MQHVDCFTFIHRQLLRLDKSLSNQTNVIDHVDKNRLFCLSSSMSASMHTRGMNA